VKLKRFLRYGLGFIQKVVCGYYDREAVKKDDFIGFT
jgi:hypothetical protein